MTLWNFIYIDDIEIEVDEDGVTNRTTKNRGLFESAKITYDVPSGKGYIHSNTEIPGLTLHLENAETIPSVWE